ncbi:MAG: TetR family transcriptional regulator C-terminal domain-containing protein, partial [Bacteroidota bacterium]
LNNFSLEVANTTPSLQQLISEGHQQFIAKIEPCVHLAQEQKEFRTDLASWDLTYALHTAFDGAIVKMKGAGNHYPLKHFLDTTFGLLTGYK